MKHVIEDRHQALIEGLDAEQAEAVMDDAEALLVVAGAGSGKTRVFVHRIARLIADGADPRSILALSYTKDAATEVASRLARMGVYGVQTMTMHAWCNREPMKRFGHLIGKEGFSILDQRGSEDVLANDLELGERAAASAKTALSFGKNVIEDADELRQRREWIEERYDAILASRNNVDFDDLQVGALRLLQEHPEVLRYYRQSLKHVLVDEYQDVNPIQHSILRGLCGRGVWPGPTITAVGDPRQSIYSFRGSDPSFIRDFGKEFGGVRVNLLNNYRSSEEIVNAANRLIMADQYFATQGRMRSMRGPSFEPIVLDGGWDENRETEQICLQIVEQIEAGVKPAEIAVLYRYHQQGELLKKALAKIEVPYYVPKDDEGSTAGVMGLDGRVVLRTIHSSKGLEYDVVFLLGWCDGSVPSFRARKDTNLLAEERRVAYVALTRARKRVFISFPRRRVIRGESVRQYPSPFLADFLMPEEADNEMKDSFGGVF